MCFYFLVSVFSAYCFKLLCNFKLFNLCAFNLNNIFPQVVSS